MDEVPQEHVDEIKAMMPAITGLASALRSQIQDYLEGDNASHEGARVALSLVMAEVKDALRWMAELALAAEEPEPTVPEQTRLRYQGPV